MEKHNIPFAGIISGQEEEDAVLSVIRSMWTVEGEQTELLQQELADFFETKFACVVNSGSSANLLALSSLELSKEDIVLSSACCFPATINPILHLGLTPYLVDYDKKTLNIDLDQVEQALKNVKISAILLANTLGSCIDLDRLLTLKNKYNFKLILDNCEAIGTKYDNKSVCYFGDISTISTYPSHQMAGINGGAVLTSDKNIYKYISSMKSWGKQHVRLGESYTKFTTNIDGIPYDENYTYPLIGYNMRSNDVCSAYTRCQLKRLPDFINKRQHNYLYLQEKLKDLPLLQMQWPEKASPCFFGYPIVCKQENIRDKLVEYLEEHHIRTRLFFSGNILRHPAYKSLKYMSLDGSNFPVADYLMRNACFCGVWPGLSSNDMEYVSTTIREFFDKGV
jgi:CDP-6-deoxy-D-xylo-4-hexulose-3-dehydrase